MRSNMLMVLNFSLLAVNLTLALVSLNVLSTLGWGAALYWCAAAYNLKTTSDN